MQRPSKMHRRTPTRRGFTLVELLVVISIIAVLASLILPGVMNARRAARRAQCLNNMKQVGIAFVDFYTSQNSFPASGRIDLAPLSTAGGGSSPTVADNLINQLQISTTIPAISNTDSYLGPGGGTGAPTQNPGGMRYSWVREMLPRLDRSDIFDLWDTSDAQGYGTYLDTVVNASGKRPPMGSGGSPGLTQTDLRVVVCPEDVTTQPGQGNLSYVVNGGFTPHFEVFPTYTTAAAAAGWVRENLFRSGLMFLEGNYVDANGNNAKYGRRHTTQSVKDGLTTTVMMSENVNAGYITNVTPTAVVATGTTGVTVNSVPEVNWACPHPFNTSFFVQTPLNSSANGGYVMDPTNTGTAYNYEVSNTRGSTSGGLNGDTTGLREFDSPYPSSFHTGGVHIMMCDGGVRFLADSVAGEIWARLVTPDGGRLAGPQVSGGKAQLVFEDATTPGNTQIPIQENQIP